MTVNVIYGAIDLTGGSAGDLDAIDGTVLQNNDIAIVVTSTPYVYIYRLNSTSGAAEASPNVISPDTNAGNKRWILCESVEEVTIPIADGIDGASPPAAAATLASTNKVSTRDFDATGDEDLYFVWEAPHNLTGGTITFRVITWVVNATGPSTEGVAFFLQGASVGDGDILSGALGTAVVSKFADETHAQYDRVTTDWSAAITITNLLAGETVLLKLYRDISDASDDYAQDIGVSAIQIKYNRKMTV